MACPFSSASTLHKDFARVRAEPGFTRSVNLKGYVISRYDDIRQVLEQPDKWSSRITFPDYPEALQKRFKGKVTHGTLINVDGPDHDRLRSSINSFFLPRNVKRLEPFIRKNAHELIDGFFDKGTIEIKAAFSFPLPLKLIVAIGGLDPERWEWIGKCLISWLGSLDPACPDDQVQDVIDIHEYIAEVIEARRTDRRGDLISHIWDQRDSGLEMTDFEHLSMLPGLLLAGFDTTTSTLSMGLANLLHHGLWEEATKDDASRSKTVEEMLRYDSAITGVPRECVVETEIGGHKFKVGDEVFVATAFGSRDPSVFGDADIFDIERGFTKQHLGFGRGMHTCIGAPVARLLLRTELEVLRERLPKLDLVTPWDEITYHPPGETRGIDKLQLRWDTTTRTTWDSNSIILEHLSRPTQNAGDMIMEVEELKMVAHDILQISLKSKFGADLPNWSPGSHIDVNCGTVGFRQYSLCSVVGQKNLWKISVLREEDGQGGSKFLHTTLHKGSSLIVRGPRNHFAFEPAKRYIFIAGGIGVTPMIPMLEQAKRIGSDYRFIYLGRSRKTMAYADELSANHPTEVWAADEQMKRFDLSRLASEDPNDLLIYCCGPERLLSAIEQVCSVFPNPVVRLERFDNAKNIADIPNTEFEVVLGRSGRKLTIPENRSVVEVLNENNCGIMTTCSKGVCGSCEVAVLAGRPEHRDAVLTSEEKALNKMMMTCISRCHGKSLTLDLW